jgi:hypothetical protein
MTTTMAKYADVITTKFSARVFRNGTIINFKTRVSWGTTPKDLQDFATECEIAINSLKRIWGDGKE